MKGSNELNTTIMLRLGDPQLVQSASRSICVRDIVPLLVLCLGKNARRPKTRDPRTSEFNTAKGGTRRKEHHRWEHHATEANRAAFV